MWHIITVDNYIKGPFKSKNDAIASYGLNDKKLWNSMKHSKDCYEYQSRARGQQFKTTYNVVNDRELQDWSGAFNHYEDIHCQTKGLSESQRAAYINGSW